MKKSPIELAKFTDATLNRVLAAIKETIEVREGDRGDPKDRFVSVRDLQDSGVIVYTGAGANFQANPLPIRLQVNLSKPPIPTGLVATGSFSNIFLTWDQYSYANHSHTEVFRAITNDRDASVSIGTALGLQFIDAVEPLTTYYYWIRFVSSAGREGDYNSGINSGTTGASLKTVSELITDMNDELNASSFATSFLDTVNSVFQGGTDAPTKKSDDRALVAGDLWFDADGVPKRYNGTTFVDASDPAIAVAQGAATDAAALADKKVQIFHQADAPFLADFYQDEQPADNYLASALGELWVDTDDNNSVHIRQGSTQFIPYVGPLEPAIVDVGDLWLDTSAISATDTTPKNITNRWDGTSWVVVQDSGIGIAKGIAEGKTTIHYQDDQPADAASEVGDLWVDTDDGDSVHRRTGVGTWTALGLATNAGVDSKITEQVGVCMFQPIDVTVDGVTTTPSPNVATAHTTKSACEAATSVDASGNPLGIYSWDNTGAIAQTLDVVTSSVGDNTATISTQTSSINGLNARYTVMIDSGNGAISGFGLASTVDANGAVDNNNPTTEFYIRADKFGLINKDDTDLNGVTSPFLVDTDPAFSEKVFAISGERFPAPYITQAEVDAANEALPSTSLFSYVFTAANTSIFLNGDTVIKRASIDSSVIKDLTVDKILRVPGEAFINEADIEDLSITTAHIKNYIESTNYANTSAGYAGWRIDKSGSANFHDLTIRGSDGAVILSTGTGIDFTGITYNSMVSSLGTLATKNSVAVGYSVKVYTDGTTSEEAASYTTQAEVDAANAANTDTSFDYEFRTDVSGLGTLATKDSVAYTDVSGSKPPTDADKTSDNTAASITNQGAYATIDKLITDRPSEKVYTNGDRDPASYTTQAQVNAANAALDGTEDFTYEFTVFTAKRRPISTYIADLAVDTLQVAGRAVTLPEGVFTAGDAPATIFNLPPSNGNLLQSVSVTNPNNFAVPYFVVFGFAFYLKKYSTYFPRILAALYVDDTVVYGFCEWGRNFTTFSGGPSGGTIISIPAYATVSIEIRVQVDVVSSGSYVNSRFIHVIGCQR